MTDEIAQHKFDLLRCVCYVALGRTVTELLTIPGMTKEDICKVIMNSESGLH